MCEERLTMPWVYMQKFKPLHTHILYNLYSFKTYEVHTYSHFMHLADHSTRSDSKCTDRHGTLYTNIHPEKKA